MINILSGALLEAAGVLLIVFRMSVLRFIAGSARVKVGQLFGVNRVGDTLFVLIIIGISLIVIGNLLIFSSFRRLRRRNDRPV
jgi:hypothetical protein